MTRYCLVLSLLQNHMAQASFQVQAFGQTFVLDVELNQWVSASRMLSSSLSSEKHWNNSVCVCVSEVWGMTNAHQIYLQRVLCCCWWTAVIIMADDLCWRIGKTWPQDRSWHLPPLSILSLSLSLLSLSLSLSLTHPPPCTHSTHSLSLHSLTHSLTHSLHYSLLSPYSRSPLHFTHSLTQCTHFTPFTHFTHSLNSPLTHYHVTHSLTLSLSALSLSLSLSLSLLLSLSLSLFPVCQDCLYYRLSKYW